MRRAFNPCSHRRLFWFRCDMKEYVFTLSARDPGCPLVETMLIRSGHDARRPEAFIAALESLVGLLKLKRTPEAAAKFIRDNASVALASKIIIGR